MPSQPPLLLVDNVFDTVVQYPSGVISASNARVGYEADYVADYRRERTSWQASVVASTPYVLVDLGVGVSRPVDSLFIDRGHNLWGKSMVVLGDNGAGVSEISTVLTVPALGTLGGDPTSGTMCVTEEGALYSLLPAMASRRRWWVYVTAVPWAPILTGVILGQRTPFLGYSRTFDDDAGERTETSLVSTVGYKGTDTTYAWRILELDLSYIDAANYDATVRMLRRRLFTQNCPFVAVMNYGLNPERAWMYQYDGKSWRAPKTRVYRSWRAQFREVGALLG